jgi:F-type H+-transporting ATPase subunit b
MEETLQTLGVYWDKLIAQMICFGVVFIVLKQFAYKPVLDLLEKRRAKIAESLANAEMIKHNLAETEKQTQQMLEQADQKATQIIEEAQQSATRMVEQKVQEAVLQAEALISKAQEAMRLEREAMLAELKKEVVTLVVQTSIKVTGKMLNPEDQSRLRQEAVDHLVA